VELMPQNLCQRTRARMSQRLVPPTKQSLQSTCVLSHQLATQAITSVDLERRLVLSITRAGRRCAPARIFRYRALP
jgi:hypothetical protein